MEIRKEHSMQKTTKDKNKILGDKFENTKGKHVKKN